MHFPTHSRGPRRALALIVAPALALALAACNGPAPEEQDRALDQAKQAAAEAAAPAPELAATPPPVASCDATQVQGLVGQAYSDALAEQARQDANATQVRVLKPEQMVTMEFLGDRLNIEVDEKNQISGVRCG